MGKSSTARGENGRGLAEAARCETAERKGSRNTRVRYIWTDSGGIVLFLRGLISLFLVALRVATGVIGPSGRVTEVTGSTDLHGGLMTCIKFSRDRRSAPLIGSNYPLTRLIRPHRRIIDEAIARDRSNCKRNQTTRSKPYSVQLVKILLRHFFFIIYADVMRKMKKKSSLLRTTFQKREQISAHYCRR